jgi:hypothetical protein
MSGTGQPQRSQNDGVHLSECTYVRTSSRPLTHVRFSGRVMMHAQCPLPEIFRQIEQWHLSIFVYSPLKVNRTPPHKQLPFSTSIPPMSRRLGRQSLLALIQGGFDVS